MSQLVAVEAVLRSEFGGALGRRPIDPTEDLLAHGVIDSFGLIGLIASLERTFGIEIVEEDVVPEHFQTLERLAAFVEAKLSAGGSREQPTVNAGD
jgi:acyl carrier protein